MPENPVEAARVEPLTEEELLESIWADPRHIDPDVLLDRLNTLLARIEALEEKVNAIKVGPGGALYGS